MFPVHFIYISQNCWVGKSWETYIVGVNTRLSTTRAKRFNPFSELCGSAAPQGDSWLSNPTIWGPTWSPQSRCSVRQSARGGKSWGLTCCCFLHRCWKVPNKDALFVSGVKGGLLLKCNSVPSAHSWPPQTCRAQSEVKKNIRINYFLMNLLNPLIESFNK